MTSLFEYAASYPVNPGWKDPDTSRSAAESMKPTAAYLRSKCLKALEKGQMSADECAVDVGESILSIRPRFSELLHLGHIVDSGLRRQNDSGRLAKVWRLV